MRAVYITPTLLKYILTSTLGQRKRDDDNLRPLEKKVKTQ
jgi:hypothetical protein